MKTLVILSVLFVCVGCGHAPSPVEETKVEAAKPQEKAEPVLIASNNEDIHVTSWLPPEAIPVEHIDTFGPSPEQVAADDAFNMAPDNMSDADYDAMRDASLGQYMDDFFKNDKDDDS